MEEGEPIEHRLISRAVANAQSKVEGRNFDIRKHLLEYDDVMNQQREIVYGRRRGILGRSNLRNDVLELVGNVTTAIVDRYASRELPPQEWDWGALDDGLKKTFGVRMDLKDDESVNSEEILEQKIVDRVHALYAEKEENFTPPVLRQLEKLVMLQTLDALWKDHLLGMDHLKEGVGLRGYGQKNPLQEYKREGFEMFEAMMEQFEADVVEKVFAVQVARQEDVERMQERRRARQPSQLVMSGGGAAAEQAARSTGARREGAKVGRNDPCPCGSGKKYKKCHGA
jgi:preprotein translocase subunit SecA